MRLDSQRTLPKVKVTGRRGGGFSLGYLSLNMGRGGSSGFNPFYNLHNQSDLEAKCEGAGHDNPACLLLCEIFPHSWLCFRSFNPITVTGQRETPYEEFTRYEIRNGVIVFTSEQKDDEDEKQKEQERKELENLCEKELDDMFTAKEDFPFAAAFGLEPSEDEAELIDGYLDQLIKLTKPIMTTGVKGYNNGKPVDFEDGQEAFNAIYVDNNGKLTRGTTLNFGTIVGRVTPTHEQDDQFRKTRKYNPYNFSQTLSVFFHTHADVKRYSVFPSPYDLARFHSEMRVNNIDDSALLGIGFISHDNYYVLLMSAENNSPWYNEALKLALGKVPRTPSEKEQFLVEYGSIIEVLLKTNKIIILDSKYSEADYKEFFDNNTLAHFVGNTPIIPASCKRLLEI